MTALARDAVLAYGGDAEARGVRLEVEAPDEGREAPGWQVGRAKGKGPTPSPHVERRGEKQPRHQARLERPGADERAERGRLHPP